MTILRREVRNPSRVYFWCPGCDESHLVTIPPHPAAWDFNGDTKRPTFTPSVKVTGYTRTSTESVVCHSFVADGQIDFLSDSTAHQLRGKHPECSRKLADGSDGRLVLPEFDERDVVPLYARLQSELLLG